MSLDVAVVHAGHDPSFGKARLREIAATYLAKWEAQTDGSPAER